MSVRFQSLVNFSNVNMISESNLNFRGVISLINSNNRRPSLRSDKHCRSKLFCSSPCSVQYHPSPSRSLLWQHWKSLHTLRHLQSKVGRSKDEWDTGVCLRQPDWLCTEATKEYWHESFLQLHGKGDSCQWEVTNERPAKSGEGGGTHGLIILNAAGFNINYQSLAWKIWAKSAKLSVLMIYKVSQSVDLGVQNLCHDRTCYWEGRGAVCSSKLRLRAKILVLKVYWLNRIPCQENNGSSKNNTKANIICRKLHSTEMSHR